MNYYTIIVRNVLILIKFTIIIYLIINYNVTSCVRTHFVSSFIILKGFLF